LSNTQNIALAFYGDDFTGSTDALEFISRAGAKAMLFIKPPTKQLLDQYTDLDVIGVAGTTRALSPEEMEKELRPAFEQLKKTGARHIHYKVCSTFDSSPSVGSIGKAIDIGSEIVQHEIIPVLGGTPSLGRYCVFGNLFARMGTGSHGDIYRLDRHPSMSQHPVTPADESDLARHLQKQTTKPIGLINLLQQTKPIEQWTDAVNSNEKALLLDALEEGQLTKVGAWLEQIAGSKTLFTVGSSAVEMALGNHWNQQGRWQKIKGWNQPGKAEPLLVLSGSCSPVTDTQVSWAVANGFAIIKIDATAIAGGKKMDEKMMQTIAARLQNKQHVIVTTGQRQAETLSSERLGTALGLIAGNMAQQQLIKRVVIAGGDTSSYAARAMGIDAVTMIAPIVSGAPLCKAFSADPFINGLEVNFKGGQVGDAGYFGRLVAGE